ncbi:hypothetical protein [Bacillus sp. JCM 19041]|uniref:hypothetical protein n=1 Tax=Bacillus sp. JCM 19041 TaxID=1460637 RepID=UPI000AF274BF
MTTDMDVITDLKESLADAQMHALITYMKKLGFSDEAIVDSLKRSLKEVRES